MASLATINQHLLIAMKAQEMMNNQGEYTTRQQQLAAIYEYHIDKALDLRPDETLEEDPRFHHEDIISVSKPEKNPFSF